MKPITCCGYLSSMKMFFVNKFRNHHIPPVFVNPHWSQLLSSTEKAAKERLRRAHLSHYDAHIPISENDRIVIATVLVWSGLPMHGEFWHLCNAMAMCVGRVTEVSIGKKIHLTPVTV